MVFVVCAEIFIGLNPKLYCDGYRPSKNDKIIYELYPNYLIHSLKAKISLQGLNDRNFSLRKPAGTFRIAVVGDSMSFGWKVDPNNSFPKVLESILNEKENGRFEVMNFSVPGYNTSQEFAILEEKIIPFNPDMIILVWCGNDVNVCNYINPKITFLNYLYNRSCFVHLTLRCLDSLLSTRLKNDFLKKHWLMFKKSVLGMFYYEQIIYPYPGLEEVIYVDGDPPKLQKDVPRQYWYMLGFENYKVNLSQIYNLLKDHNIVFVWSGFLYSKVASIIAELGVKYVCDFHGLLKENKIIYKDITQLPEDGHWSEHGHRLIAEYTYNFLKKAGLLKNHL